jgi:type II secretory pathway component PulF
MPCHLLKEGLPFERSFEIIAGEADDPRVRRAAEVIGERMRAGGFMSEYIADMPELFPPVAATLIWAGEQAGNFYDTLGMVADQDAEILPVFRTSVQNRLTCVA